MSTAEFSLNPPPERRIEDGSAYHRPVEKKAQILERVRRIPIEITTCVVQWRGMSAGVGASMSPSTICTPTLKPTEPTFFLQTFNATKSLDCQYKQNYGSTWRSDFQAKTNGPSKPVDNTSDSIPNVESSQEVDSGILEDDGDESEEESNGSMTKRFLDSLLTKARQWSVKANGKPLLLNLKVRWIICISCQKGIPGNQGMKRRENHLLYKK